MDQCLKRRVLTGLSDNSNYESASSGGAKTVNQIRVADGADKFTFDGGTIAGNTATGNGGGIYVNSAETLEALLAERSGIDTMRYLGSVHTDIPVGVMAKDVYDYYVAMIKGQQ